MFDLWRKYFSSIHDYDFSRKASYRKVLLTGLLHSCLLQCCTVKFTQFRVKCMHFKNSLNSISALLIMRKIPLFLLILASTVHSFKHWQSCQKWLQIDYAKQTSNFATGTALLDVSHYVEIGPKGQHNFLAQIVTFLKQSLHCPHLV